MDATPESSPASRLFDRQAQALTRPMTQARRMANVVRDLITRSSHAPSGHADLALAMADVATVLWTRFHKFDAADPSWPDRDRFVLAGGHKEILLYALIHLTGHDGLAIDDLLDGPRSASAAFVHPGYIDHPAIETTTGPLGQGLATAVGFALAERNMAARFGKSLVDHRTWVIAAADELLTGLTHEAAGLAGHLGLSKLAVLYDEPADPPDGPTDPSYAENTLKRFSAYGWATRRVDGHDPNDIIAALSFAMRSRKPTLIACRTSTGHGAIHLTPAAFATDSHLPPAPVALLASRPAEPPFAIPGDLRALWHAAGSRGAAARRSWLKRLARNSHRNEFDRVTAGRLPDNWHEAVVGLKQQIADDRPMFAARASSQKCLDALVPVIPEIVSGAAHATGTGLVRLQGSPLIGAGHFSGRHVQWTMREHAMAAAANGLALHGGIIPVIGSSLLSCDAARPALRLAAIMRQRVVYVMSQDPAELAGDDPARLPVEHLATLRPMPNLHIFCPGDVMETAECFELALRRSDGPSLIVVPPGPVPVWRADTTENRCARGGYVLAEADGPRQATIIATGSEVSIAMAAREKLAGDNITAAVVSLPCWALFALQDKTYRAQVLGGAPRVGVEAASGFGWDQWLGPHGTFIGITGFAPTPSEQNLHYPNAVTPQAVVAAVLRQLDNTRV